MLSVTGALTATTAPSLAQEEPPHDGLTWRVSQQVWTSSSLAGAHDTGEPAVKTDEGFNFPETTEATYDPVTGAGQIDFPGYLEMGNTNQGNYRIRIADPSIVLHVDGTGELVADVSYALFQDGSHVWSEPARATAAELIIPEGAIADDGERISFTITPEWHLRTDLDPNPDGWRQFPQPFLDALAPAVPSLLNHFRESGGGAAGQPAKAPAAISVDVAYQTPPELDPDAALIDALYRALLGRSVGEADLTFWISRLQGGYSSGQVAADIAGSPEARTRLVRLTYQAVLGRPGDTAGVNHWSIWLSRGNAAESLVVNLLSSPESWARHGATPEGLATAAYGVFLGRAPDAAGLAYWADRLSGPSRQSVLRAFGRTSAATQHGVRDAVDRACGAGVTPDPAQQTDLEFVWGAWGRHPLRTAAYAVDMVCPAGPIPS